VKTAKRACTTGGRPCAKNGSRQFQAFVAGERSGRWGNAIEIPGSSALNGGGDAFAFAVWCGKAGNCAAGGNYLDSSGHVQGFVVSRA
jgi:hypothetical protein